MPVQLAGNAADDGRGEHRDVGKRARIKQQRQGDSKEEQPGAPSPEQWHGGGCKRSDAEDPEIWGEQHIGQHVVAPAVEIGFFDEVGDADAQRNGSDVDKRCCDREFEAAQNPFRGHR